jgi:hypothetical protein
MWTCGQSGSEAATFVRRREALIRFFAIFSTSLSFADAFFRPCFLSPMLSLLSLLSLLSFAIADPAPVINGR